jgi:hypothetical protein
MTTLVEQAVAADWPRFPAAARRRLERSLPRFHFDKICLGEVAQIAVRLSDLHRRRPPKIWRLVGRKPPQGRFSANSGMVDQQPSVAPPLTYSSCRPSSGGPAV